MNTVFISTDPFDVSALSEHQTDDIVALIREKFSEWPKTARIYHEFVAADHEVTPRDENGIVRLQTLTGIFYVVVLPGAPLIIPLAISAFLSVISFILNSANPGVPVAPVSTQRNIAQSSPNNELSARSNSARLNGRIPDIYGTVRSTPDLIAVPYSIFVDHEEIEIAYMCIGRGEYDVTDPRDGDTAIADIEGAAVEVYGPFTSPNSGDSPQLSVGPAIDTAVANVSRLTAVNGQVLLAPNANGVRGDSNVRYASSAGDYLIECSDPSIILSDFFTAGTSATITNGTFSTTRTQNVSADISTATFRLGSWAGGIVSDAFVVGGHVIIAGLTFNDGVSDIDLSGTYVVAALGSDYMDLVSPGLVNGAWSHYSIYTGSTIFNFTATAPTIAGDLSGTYVVASVSATAMAFVNPQLINSDWNLLAGLGGGGRTDYESPLVFPAASSWIGPFRLAEPSLDRIVLNFVALNGLYRDDGTVQTRIDVSLDIEITPVDTDGTPSGSPVTTSDAIIGSSGLRSTRALTSIQFPVTPGAGGVSIRVRRSNDYDYTFVGTTVDEVKWRDCYSSAPFAVSDFGNVTTVQTMTHATAGALAVKQRKFSCLVSRKVLTVIRDGGGTITGTTSVPTASSNAADILCAVALDPYIGRRSLAEIDRQNIYNTVGDVIAYFGDPLFGEFNYTFDKSGLSFEESVALIAQAICCTAYRRGSQIKLSFERATENSGLLFNHRNKIPKSEVRTIRWGLPKDYDGVEYSYVSPVDDAIVTYYIPEDRSATTPQKIESIGIRHEEQAYVLAWRAYNKMLYQNTTTTFDALQEADLLVLQDRILVADNTRSGTMDGEVASQDVLTIELSQKAVLDPAVDYTIFLQNTDSSVDSMDVMAGADSRHVVLEHAPSSPLSLDINNAVRAVYQIVRDDAPRKSAFLVTEKRPKDNFTSTLTAINYDARYYQNDLTYPA